MITRGTRVYRRVVGTTPCAYTVWDEVDTNGGTPGVVWGVDEDEARERVVEAARAWRDACGKGADLRLLTSRELEDALAALDALEGADTEGHDG